MHATHSGAKDTLMSRTNLFFFLLEAQKLTIDTVQKSKPCSIEIQSPSPLGQLWISTHPASWVLEKNRPRPTAISLGPSSEEGTPFRVTNMTDSLQGQAGKRHLNTLFSPGRINRLGRTAYASVTQSKMLRKLLPYA